MYALIVLLMLNIIIVVHELGHFITAKFLGINPNTFAIGFGKTLYAYKGKDGTLYKVNILPLGGYVDFDMKTFSDEVAWKKFLIFYSGIVFNFLLALLIAFMFVLIAKIPLDFSNKTLPIYDGNIITILQFTWQSVINTISIIFKSLLDLIINPNFNSVMGPIQLINEGSSIMKEGAILSLPLFLMIDINIMLFNALPFPSLDGGRASFSVIEMMTRKRFRHEEKIHFVGIIMLMTFMVFILTKDIYTLFV